jgi:hypothetical protein
MKALAMKALAGISFVLVAAQASAQSWNASPYNWQNNAYNWQNSPYNWQNSPYNMNSTNGIYNESGNRFGYSVPTEKWRNELFH